MPSLHSTLAVLMENLVRDLLVAVRESSLHELASSGSPQSAAKKAASKKEKPPSRPSPKVRAKARRAPSKTTKAKPLERVRVVFAEPPQVEQGDLDAQITDPDGLLREDRAGSSTDRGGSRVYGRREGRTVHPHLAGRRRSPPHRIRSHRSAKTAGSERKLKRARRASRHLEPPVRRGPPGGRCERRHLQA
jgi:hypothetical protein